MSSVLLFGLAAYLALGITQKYQAVSLSEQPQPMVSGPENPLLNSYVTQIFDRSGNKLTQVEGKFQHFSPNGRQFVTDSGSYMITCRFSIHL